MPHKLIIGKNDLASQRPDLVAEWDFAMNGEQTPQNTTVFSNKRVWWICSKCGHRWNSTVSSRSKGCGCRKCNNSWTTVRREKLLSKSGSLAILYPSIAKEWDEERNSPLTPNDVTPGSNKKIWWICPRKHSYQSAVCNRVQGKGCPICIGKKILVGYNDLATLYPLAAEMWDYQKNGVLNPKTVGLKSHHKVWWKCSQGHSWQSKISHFTDGHRCPYCDGQRAIEGVNDITNTNASLAAEWDYEKNKTPITKVMQSSGIKYWWKCSFGHSWQASPAHRSAGEGCPICSSTSKTSFPEKCLFHYIKHFFLDAEPNYKNPKLLGNFELDVYIPSIKCGIEYDGVFYHQNKEKDERKDSICNEHSIKLIRVREPGCPLLKSSKCIQLHSLSSDELSSAIKQALKQIGVAETNIDVDRDRYLIESEIDHSIAKNSLAFTHPELCKEWDYELNGSLTPFNVSRCSEKKVWWKCKVCGLSWQAIVANRSKGSGCVFCSKNKRPLAKYNPTLAEEWDYELNGSLSPSDVSVGSAQYIWWKCKTCGKSWKSRVSTRNKGHGCPHCQSLKHPGLGKARLAKITKTR